MSHFYDNEIAVIVQQMLSNPAVGRKRLREELHRIAQEVAEEFQGKSPLFVPVHKGASRFMADLEQYFPQWFTRYDVEPVRVSSYRNETEPGLLNFDSQHLTAERLRGRQVCIVDDILQTGATLEAVTSYVSEHSIESLRAAILIRKECDQRDPNLHVRFLGFDLPDRFYVGYGMDFANLFRTLNQICVLRGPQKERIKQMLPQTVS